MIFGLTVSSSWGNGHATLWRGLLRSLAGLGHEAIFFEKDVPYYAAARDFHGGQGYDLRLYSDWEIVLPEATREAADADVVMVTSYCPDAIAATELALASSRPLRVFYDLDTPITLERLGRGESVEYIPSGGFRDFDLVLSYTGGSALDALRNLLGARTVAPLYGSVDTAAHFPVPPQSMYRCDLSYLGTYAADRQAGVERLLIEPARRLPSHRFIIGGSMYPVDFPWAGNIWFMRHVPPPDHPAFYCSSHLTLNVTRAAMARMGYCPSGRLFEAAACGTAILSDAWDGLDEFFEPGREIIVAETSEQAISAISAAPEELARIGRAARERALADHTSRRRAEQLVELVGGAHKSSSSLTASAGTITTTLEQG